jgi:adenine phosphoribosyltransferase
MSDTGYGTSELARAIASATSSKIDAPDGGSYQFHRFAFGERGDFIPAPLLDEIVGSLVSLAQRVFAAPDVIVSPEPGGHTWGMAVARQLGTALSIFRADHGADAVAVRSAYRALSFRRPLVPRGARVLVVDDVISSGGTFAALLRSLAESGCEVLGGMVILAKSEQGLRQVRAAGYPVLALATLAEGRILPHAEDSASV